MLTERPANAQVERERGLPEQMNVSLVVANQSFRQQRLVGHFGAFRLLFLTKRALLALSYYREHSQNKFENFHFRPAFTCNEKVALPEIQSLNFRSQATADHILLVSRSVRFIASFVREETSKLESL